jgi:ketosteroid isomerase-like protein
MLPDAIAVTNLLYRYGELIDRGDFDGVADLLGDVVITVEGVPGEQRGRPTILAMYVDWTRRYDDDGTPHTRHLISNPIVEVDEVAGSATIRSSYTVFQGVDGLPLQPIIIGRYHDTFAKVDGEWRYDRRHLFTDLVGDLSHHLLIPLT